MMKKRTIDSAIAAQAGFLLVCLFAPAAFGDTPAASLDDQLRSLNLPANEAPAGVSNENLYSVQSRYAPLAAKSEFDFGGGMNFTPDGLLNSEEMTVGYRLHFSDRWSLGADGSYVFNSLNSAGQTLVDRQGVLPYAPYTKYRADLMAGFNAFYGKIRLGLNNVIYFDQYWNAGPGWVWLDSGNAPAAVGDVGLVVWLGKRGSVRSGFKDYFFNEPRPTGNATTNHLIGHLDLGFLLGGPGT